MRCLLAPLFFILCAAKVLAAIPDFTNGDTLPPESPHAWNLGPTGTEGWVYCEKGASSKSRQILITKVAQNSPAANLLEKGDVILGTDGSPFQDDARITLAKAITKAEGSDGKLALQVWREGKTRNISLPLKVLGSYANTAPFNCQKSEKIVAQGCAQTAKSMTKPDDKRRNVVVQAINTLALMASGDEKWMPLVEKSVKKLQSYKIQDGDLHSWSSGWVNILMCEYYLRTQDSSVLPTIKRLSQAIAEGQSHVGTWGHRFAIPGTGVAQGYGSMNQVGISLTLSLVLAKQCGIKSSKVDTAIEKGQRFLRFYVGKGSIPYGDHHPFLKTHDDNGKSAGAVVLYDLLNDAVATHYFAKSTLASYGVERETGHTGNFFNMFWALLGITRNGEHATGAWMQESAWLMDLARTHTGSFDFLGKPGAVRGEHSYTGWDCTGAYVLPYAIPQKNLMLTGMRKSCIPQMTRQQAAAVIAQGKGWAPDTQATSYQKYSSEALLNALSSWSPVIRERAAIALKSQPNTILPLIEKTQSKKIEDVLGACAALEQLGSKGSKAIPQLRALLKSEDYWVRIQAAEALASIGDPTTIPDLLELIIQQPLEGDRREYLRRYVGYTLFDSRNGLFKKSMNSIDHELLAEVVHTLLKNEDGKSRSSLKPLLIKLPPSQIKPLLPAIYQAVVEPAPSGIMFADGIRLTGLEILARNRVAEGLPLCLDLIDIGRWGLSKRWFPCFKALRIYGPDAKTELPHIKAFAQQMLTNPKHYIADPSHPSHNKKMAEHYHTLIAIIKEIESAPAPSTPMLSISEIQR